MPTGIYFDILKIREPFKVRIQVYFIYGNDFKAAGKIDEMFS